MKCLSIRQPWAWLILNAGKDIENRDWPTRYRGRVLVHASKGMTRSEYDDAIDQLLWDISGPSVVVVLPHFEELQRGGIVGSVEIVGCVTHSESPWFCGRFGFMLSDPKPITFIPYRGSLGLFEVPDRPEFHLDE